MHKNISLTIFDIVWSSRSYLIPLTLFVRKYPSLICWPWKLWWKPCNEKIFSLIVQTIKSKNYYCITFVVRSFNYQIIIIWNQKKYFVYWINYQNYVKLYFVDNEKCSICAMQDWGSKWNCSRCHNIFVKGVFWLFMAI